MQSQPLDSNKNIIVGPDYGQMIQSQTNGAIVEAFISTLFSKDTKFNASTVMTLVRNMAILMAIKTTLEDSKSYLNNFKFTNLNFFRYLYQYIRYSEIKYQLILVSGKWLYCGNKISIDTLTSLLENKGIPLSQPGTYYFNYRSYLIKVNITLNSIIFTGPNISASDNYIINEIIHKNKEILIGNKTIMCKMVYSSCNILNIEPMQLSYAFSTKNYEKLEESINSYFLMDSLFRSSNTPFCISFDGEPGTGKTTFGSYIASSGIFDRIITCNLVQATNISFYEIITNLERRLSSSSSKEKRQDNDTESILLILDEIDKWFESYVSFRIHKLRDESREKKQVKDEQNRNLTVESYEKLSTSEEQEKSIQIKSEFLDQLYKLVDGHILMDTKKYVIIFNTNNFDKLFSDSNQRYGALLDRFQRYTFRRICKDEVIAYFKCIKNELRKRLSQEQNNPKIAQLQEKFSAPYSEEIFDLIPNDISITYRTLQKILRMASFKIDDAIKMLGGKNEYLESV